MRKKYIFANAIRHMDENPVQYHIIIYSTTKNILEVRI